MPVTTHVRRGKCLAWVHSWGLRIPYRSYGHGRFRYFAVGVANVGSTPIPNLPLPSRTRTTAPAISTSTAGTQAASGAGVGTKADTAGSARIGTKSGTGRLATVPSAGGASTPAHVWRRHPNTRCELNCHRRATSDTTAPGAIASATIRALSSANQRRRRPGPVSTSTRRYSAFASSLPSNIMSARSSPPQATQPHSTLSQGQWPRSSAYCISERIKLVPSNYLNDGSGKDFRASKISPKLAPLGPTYSIIFAET